MTWEIYLAFILATALLAIIPGPVVTLLVATGVRHGSRSALITLTGSSSALIIQVTVVALGMTSLLTFLGAWFEWLKWAGVAYFIWLGLQQFLNASETDSGKQDLLTGHNLYGRGLFIGLTNPKTLLFYAAFFPQFLVASEPAGPQLALLCPTFVLVGSVIDGAYALTAGHARSFLESDKAALWRNRFSGSLLIAAGIGLAFTRRT